MIFLTKHYVANVRKIEYIYLILSRFIKTHALRLELLEREETRYTKQIQFRFASNTSFYGYHI